MDVNIRITGLGGSLASASTSLAALRIALDGAAVEGAETQLFDVRTLDLPMYDPDATTHPESALHFVDDVYAAHGLIWSSPLYHGTISGALKNALDWLQLLGTRNPPYLTNKIIGLISVAGGVHGLQAVNTMEFAVRALRGWAVPLVLPIARARQAFDERGRPRDLLIEQQLQAVGQEVARATRQFVRGGYCEYAEEHLHEAGMQPLHSA
jgi:FMN reductase